MVIYLHFNPYLLLVCLTCEHGVISAPIRQIRSKYVGKGEDIMLLFNILRFIQLLLKTTSQLSFGHLYE